MDFDLNNLLEGWDHEPGQIKVRKIAAADGSEKLQLRIDLGVIQMETSGRPDGTRPHGCESLLAYHMQEAAKEDDRGKEYTLSPEDCNDLQQEGIQYYHRYVSLFQIEDFVGVIRDTARNLELFDFVSDQTDDDEIALSFEQFRPYVIMMNVRARASILIGTEDYDEAEAVVKEGREWIVEHYEHLHGPDSGDESPEVQFLDSWLDEALSGKPLSDMDRMNLEMQLAIKNESYERAAEIRDAIRALANNQAS